MVGVARVAVVDEPVDERLRHVLDHREAAGRVAVQRRVADRVLGLVAGRQHEPAELVRERHQQVAADPRLQVLLGDVRLAAAERSARAARRRPPSPADRDLVAARRRGSRPAPWRRRACPRTSSATASSRRHAVGARARRRRPAASASSRSRRTARSRRGSKPFLRDVVARAEHERRVDLGLGLEQRRDVAARRRRRRRPRAAPAAPSRRTSGSARRTGVRSRVSRSRAVSAACRSTVADGQRLRELRRAREHACPRGRSAASGRRRPARPGRRRGCRTRRPHRLSRARWISIRSRSTPLPRVVRRRGGVEDQRRAGQRLVGGRRAGRPDVLADRQAEPRVAELEHRAALADLEVALLVEHAVVRQHRLAVDGLQLALGEHGERVVDVVGALREADQRDDPLGLARELGDRLARRPAGSAPSAAGPRADSR